MVIQDIEICYLRTVIMRHINRKTLIMLFFATIIISTLYLPASANVKRQSVHINTPGIGLEIPGNAVYKIKESKMGELFKATDPDHMYTLTLTANKDESDVFTYKDMPKNKMGQTLKNIKAEQNADKVTTYETSQAVFIDCINNTDKCLVSTTIVNGYKYDLKLIAPKRDLTISDHGIFNTAARSIIFDNIEKRPTEVNIFNLIGTTICTIVAILVLSIILVVLYKYINAKIHSGKNIFKLGNKMNYFPKCIQPALLYETTSGIPLKKESKGLIPANHTEPDVIKNKTIENSAHDKSNEGIITDNQPTKSELIKNNLEQNTVNSDMLSKKNSDSHNKNIIRNKTSLKKLFEKITGVISANLKQNLHKNKIQNKTSYKGNVRQRSDSEFVKNFLNDNYWDKYR